MGYRRPGLPLILPGQVIGTVPVGPSEPSLVNPMTTEGDLISGGASGIPARLAVGIENDILFSNGTDPAWGTLADIGGLPSTTTIALAKLTTLGTAGSLTLINGLVTAYTPPT